MGNLKVNIAETAIVGGKAVSNSRDTNISGINNIYQETIKLDNRPSSYLYLYMEEGTVGNLDGETVYIEAHTDRTFTFTGDGTGPPSTTVEMDDILHASVTDNSVGVGLAPSMRLDGDIIPTTETHADGADDRVISVTDNDTFVIAGNTVSGTNQLVSVYGNERTIEDSVMVSGEKYITHTHPDPSQIKLGMRVSGTSIGTNAYVTKIISDKEFEVSVNATGSSTNDIYITDSIKVEFDDSVTQANSTIHKAGVNGLTTKKDYLKSLKISLDLWVSAGAPFVIGSVVDVTFPYLKISHAEPGDSVVSREVYGSAYKDSLIYASTRTNALIANKSDKFTNEAVSPLQLLSISDTVSGSRSQSRSAGSASFSGDDLKYIRITNTGRENVLIYTHVGSSDLKAWARRDTRTAAIEASSNLAERYGTDQYFVNKLLPGQSLVYNNAFVDMISDSGHAPQFTEIDTIYGVSESSSVDGKVEIFVASK
jgi:hypothetical protein